MWKCSTDISIQLYLYTYINMEGTGTEETYGGDTALNIVQFIIKLKLVNFHVSKDCLFIGGSGILLGICE